MNIFKKIYLRYKDFLYRRKQLTKLKQQDPYIYK